MTVQTDLSRHDYTASAGQTVFPYTFSIFEGADVKVYVDNELKAFGVQYTVAGTEGGNMTLLTPCIGGETVTLLRVLPLTQDLDLAELSAFPAEANERALDRGVMIDQQLAEVDSRAIVLAPGSAQTGKMIDDLEAGKLLRVKPDESGIEMADVTAIGTITIPVPVSQGGGGGTTALTNRQGWNLDGQVRKVFTNRTGVALAVGDVVTYDANNDDSVVLGDTVASKGTFVIAAQAIANGATGEFILEGVMTVNVTGSVARGRYLRKSNTTKVAEDAGVAMTAANDPPQGTFAVAIRNSAAGSVLAYGFAFVPIIGTPIIAGMYGVREFRGDWLNATSYRLIAAQVQLFRISDGSIVVRHAPATLTNVVTVAGPTANGRDQAGAFAANSWIHFYYIWNGTTLASLSSGTAPPSAPTLPATYTHWAYATSIRFDNSSQLLNTRVRGSWARPTPLITLITGYGGGTLPVTLIVPPNALNVEVQLIVHLIAGSTVPAWNEALAMTAGGLDPMRASATSYLANNGAAPGQIIGVLPNYDGLVYVTNEPFNAPTTATLDLYVRGYQIANGDA